MTPLPRAYGNLCVAISGPTMAQAMDCLERSRGRADMVEFRLDLIHDYDLPLLLRARSCPAIVTLRPSYQGGLYVGDEPRRLDELRRAAALGAEWIDVELAAASSLGSLVPARRIVSYHDFTGVPARLEDILTNLWETGPDAVKLAVMVERPAQVGPLLRLWRQACGPSILLAMGASGVASRLLCLRSRACLLTYVAASPAEGTAPGQVTLDDAEQIYRARSLTSSTVAVGYLGPAEHRPFLRALNHALWSLGRDAVAVPLGPITLAEGLAAMPALDLAGLVLPPNPDVEEQAASLLPCQGSRADRANVVLAHNGRPIAAWAPTPAQQAELVMTSLE